MVCFAFFIAAYISEIVHFEILFENENEFFASTISMIMYASMYIIFFSVSHIFKWPNRK